MAQARFSTLPPAPLPGPEPFHLKVREWVDKIAVQIEKLVTWARSALLQRQEPLVWAWKRDESYQIEVELADVDPYSLKIEIAGGVVSLRGDRPGEGKAERFWCSLEVPPNALVAQAQATYREGRVQIRIPLLAPAPERISLRVDGLAA